MPSLALSVFLPVLPLAAQMVSLFWGSRPPPPPAKPTRKRVPGLPPPSSRFAAAVPGSPSSLDESPRESPWRFMPKTLRRSASPGSASCTACLIMLFVQELIAGSPTDRRPGFVTLPTPCPPLITMGLGPATASVILADARISAPFVYVRIIPPSLATDARATGPESFLVTP